MKKLLLVRQPPFSSSSLLVKTMTNVDSNTTPPEETQLVTPEVRARIADPLNQNPFTGILEIYPCNAETSIYYGNFINGNKTVFNGYYNLILDGHVYGEYNRLLHLPLGTYNMVYWGTPKYDDPIYNTPAINSPGITQGVDLSNLYFRLRADTDKILTCPYMI